MDSIYIRKDSSKFDIEEIITLLHKSEWAAKRETEEIQKSVENSTCYGVFKEGKMIGFARIISDFVTTFYLMDVMIDEAYRGQGLGKILMDAIMNDVGHLYGILHTNSAQGFYEPYGFEVTATSEAGESIMEKARDINCRKRGRDND